MGAIVRRAGVTMAISTDGEAPALAGLMREALEHSFRTIWMPGWRARARRAATGWRGACPMAERRPLLLEALVALYESAATGTGSRIGTRMSFIPDAERHAIVAASSRSWVLVQAIPAC